MMCLCRDSQFKKKYEKERRKTRDAPPAWEEKKGEETNKKKKKWRWQQTFNPCGTATQLINITQYNT